MIVTQTKNEGASATTREGFMPDGSYMSEIMVYAPHDQITRLAILMDYADYKLVDRRNDWLRPSKDVALFQKVS